MRDRRRRSEDDARWKSKTRAHARAAHLFAVAVRFTSLVYHEIRDDSHVRSWCVLSRVSRPAPGGFSLCECARPCHVCLCARCRSDGPDATLERSRPGRALEDRIDMEIQQRSSDEPRPQMLESRAARLTPCSGLGTGFSVQATAYSDSRTAVDVRIEYVRTRNLVLSTAKESRRVADRVSPTRRSSPRSTCAATPRNCARSAATRPRHSR